MPPDGYLLCLWGTCPPPLCRKRGEAQTSSGGRFRSNRKSCRDCRFDAGPYGAARPRHAPHDPPWGTFPWVASRPAGKRPCAFPRTPFAASVRKISAYMAFYIYAACVQPPPYEIRQRLYSRPYCSGALGFLPPSRHAGSGKASLAPCALGGDRLATTVCGRRMPAVVSVTANESPDGNNIHLFAKQFERRSCFATGESEGVYFPYTTERTTEQGARCAKVQSKKNGRDREIRQGAKRRRAVRNKPKASAARAHLSAK